MFLADLAREGAEVEWLLEDPVTCEADVAGALERPGLRPRLQEDHLGTVDGVGLHRHITEGIINSKSSATQPIFFFLKQNSNLQALSHHSGSDSNA